MFRKPLFWVVFSLVSIGSAIFAFNYFSSAFPLVNLDIQMNRQAALDAAAELASANRWGPEQFDKVASFGVDSRVQNFVELEAGGVKAFRQMLADTLYSPYTWRVRLYKEGFVNECNLYFTPQGKFYGFSETVPEDQPGAALTPDSARAVAEQTAVKQWNIHPDAYELVEQSRDVRPAGRIDHTFVYERPDTTIGEGRYRLRLAVSGDKLTTLRHFVKIPEGFSRRYDEMRSANETIAMVSMIAIGLLYVIGGIIFGLFYLLKLRWVLWRKALIWGVIVAFLQVLASVNQWPLLWMNYDTALAAQSFFLQQIMQILLSFIGLTVLFTASFMAAESLTRLAFPDHVRFWHLWHRDVAASKPVLGQTLGGFLLVSVFFAFDIALYFFAANVLGWWSPSGALFEPDVLASYFPWLQSIATSLQAGFMEECLFRAIPIAGAVIIGRRFGHKTAWVVAAFILQAVIFGAGHANYPNQPAYARVVELILPSIGFGLIYYFFGLLPAIIMHFAYDVVWFALPLFVSSAPGVRIDQLIVIMITLTPLWVVLIARLRTGAWLTLKDNAYNRTWTPPQKETVSVPEEKATPQTGGFSVQSGRGLLIAGIIALLIWVFLTDFENQAPPMAIDRSEALAVAERELQRRQIDPDDSWQPLKRVVEPLDQEDRFVWQEGDASDYRALMGSYLDPPQWLVRYVRFSGDVAGRAEEYRIFVGPDGKVRRFHHKLPEKRAGADLNADSSSGIARTFIKQTYGLDAADLKTVAAKPSKLPNRTDWTYTYADTIHYPLEKGQARIDVTIAGTEVVDSYRYIHVPEDWQRQERNQGSLMSAFRTLNSIFMLLLFLAGVIIAIVYWSRKQFSVSTFIAFVALVLGLQLIDLFNSLPSVIAGFSTSEPYRNQLIAAVGMPVIGFLFLSAAVGLLNGFTRIWKGAVPAQPTSRLLSGGFSAGAIIAGVSAIVSVLQPELKPFWADYESLAHHAPFLEGVNTAARFILVASLFLFLFTALHRLTHYWQKRRVLFSVLFLLVGFIVSGATDATVAYWVLSGFVQALVYWLLYIFVFRRALAVIPLAFGTASVLNALKDVVIGAHPFVPWIALIAILLTAAIAYYWFRMFQTSDRTLPKETP